MQAIASVFTGDFNMGPGSKLYQFLEQGQLDLTPEEDRRNLSGRVFFSYQEFSAPNTHDTCPFLPVPALSYGGGCCYQSLYENIGAYRSGILENIAEDMSAASVVHSNLSWTTRALLHMVLQEHAHSH